MRNPSYDMPCVNMTGDERKTLRNRLKWELEQVRSMHSRLEARETQLRGVSGVATLQSTCSDGHALIVEGNRSAVPEVSPPTQRSHVLPDVGSTGVGTKDNRAPKANELHENSQFAYMKEKSALSKKPNSMEARKRCLKETANSGNHKRQKMDVACNKKFAEVARLCGTILKTLMLHKHGWVFNEPVDVVKLGLHDYFTIIKKPMDLGTIKAKLDSRKYTSPCEFAEDVRLTFANALRYNPPGHDVHAMADFLRKLFENRWRSMEQKFKILHMAEDRIIAQDVQPYSARISQTELGKPHRAIGDSRLLYNVASKTKLFSKMSKPPKPKALRPGWDMPLEEKRKLVNNFENLPEDKLEQVFQIIKDSDPNLMQTDNEIEIEINCLDRNTLWELHRIVTSCSKIEGEVEKEGRKVLDGEVIVGQVCGSVSDLTFCGTGRGDVDEEVDIGNEIPSAGYPVIDKHGGPRKCSSSGSSGSESGSSSGMQILPKLKRSNLHWGSSLCPAKCFDQFPCCHFTGY